MSVAGEHAFGSSGGALCRGVEVPFCTGITTFWWAVVRIQVRILDVGGRNVLLAVAEYGLGNC